MEPGNYLLYAAYTGNEHIHLVRPAKTGEILAIGKELFPMIRR